MLQPRPRNAFPRIGLVTAVAVLALANWHPSHAEPDDARTALAQILAFDLAGDPMGRINGLVSMSGAPSMSTRMSVLFQPLSSAIVVVTGWKITSAKVISPGEIQYTVCFRQVADTSGAGGLGSPNPRKLVRIQPYADVAVNYGMVHLGQEWRLANAPIPRVNLEDLIIYAKNSLKLGPNYPVDDSRPAAVNRRAVANDVDFLEHIEKNHGDPDCPVQK